MSRKLTERLCWSRHHDALRVLRGALTGIRDLWKMERHA